MSGLPTSFGISDEHRQPDSQNHRCRDSRLGSGLSTSTNSQTVRTTDVGTPGLGRNFGLSEVPTHVGTSDVHSHHASYDWELALPTVGSSGLRRDFRHHLSQKNNLRARGVLECLSFDFIFMLEYSIFLRPTKFASLFIVRQILNSKTKLNLWRAF